MLKQNIEEDMVKTKDLVPHLVHLQTTIKANEDTTNAKFEKMFSVKDSELDKDKIKRRFKDFEEYMNRIDIDIVEIAEKFKQEDFGREAKKMRRQGKHESHLRRQTSPQHYSRITTNGFNGART